MSVITATETRPDGYKWIALSNCTLAILLATLDGSITIIAMPDIFRGIHLDPLQPGNSFYLLWMVLGYLIVTSVLIVSFGKLGDMYGRVKMYNLGFIIYTVASLVLTVDWMTGTSGALYLIIFRLVQGVGGAFLLANTAAIITDAFPSNQRGMALGINNIVGVSGVFVGLVIGGLLAPINWRLVFLISVPVGLFGTVWAYLKLQELSRPQRTRIDWAGNVTFALGLVLIMVAITHGIRPYGDHATGWLSPQVLIELGLGVLSLIAFMIIELVSKDPMFKLQLLRIRAFTFGTFSTFLSALSRGGLMFVLIIWLQGIWLPLHGTDFADTPFKAGLFMLPLTLGMLIAGPTSGYLSDRYGARLFATGGMLASAATFGLLILLPTDFSYPVFGFILFLMGISMGLFASPNRAAVMNSLPAGDRGSGGGMNQTFQNSAQVLSVGVFFYADDRRALQLTAAYARRGPPGSRRLGCRRGQGRGRTADHSPVLGVPRLQPDQAPRRLPGAELAVGARPGDPGRARLLPDADRGAVPLGTEPRLLVLHRRLPDRRRGVGDAWWHLPPRRDAGRAGRGGAPHCAGARAGRAAAGLVPRVERRRVFAA